jgi:hypothetical protein
MEMYDANLTPRLGVALRNTQNGNICCIFEILNLGSPD